MKELQEELANALTLEAFPIRGWGLQFVRTPIPERHVFEILPQAPELNPLDRTVVAKPDKIDEVLAVELKAYAVFSVPKTLEITPFHGRTLFLNPQCLDKQYVTIHQPERRWDIHIDFRVPAAYEASTILPDPKSFAIKVEKWAEILRKEDEHPHARFVLAQLKAFQENGLRTLRTLLQNIVQTVKNSEPDYFAMVERLMRGEMTRGQVHAQARSRGKQVIVILNTPSGALGGDKPTLM